MPHLSTWEERDTVRVKALTQEHNTMSLTKTWALTAWYRDEHAIHETIALPNVVQILSGRSKLHVPLKISSFQSYMWQLKYFSLQTVIEQCTNWLSGQYGTECSCSTSAINLVFVYQRLPHRKQYDISYKTACYPHYCQLDTANKANTHVNQDKCKMLSIFIPLIWCHLYILSTLVWRVWL